MKRETITRHARATWRAGFAVAVVASVPCAALSALGRAQGAAAGILGALAVAGSAAAAVAGAILGDDF